VKRNAIAARERITVAAWASDNSRMKAHSWGKN
jgi:hypothetical protein